MILGNSITISPAYGRDYRTAAEAIADWRAGRDFSIGGPGGPYCSIRDIPALPQVRTVRIRFAKLRKLVELSV